MRKERSNLTMYVTLTELGKRFVTWGRVCQNHNWAPKPIGHLKKKGVRGPMSGPNRLGPIHFRGYCSQTIAFCESVFNEENLIEENIQTATFSGGLGLSILSSLDLPSSSSSTPKLISNDDDLLDFDLDFAVTSFRRSLSLVTKKRLMLGNGRSCWTRKKGSLVAGKVCRAYSFLTWFLSIDPFLLLLLVFSLCCLRWPLLWLLVPCV